MVVTVLTAAAAANGLADTVAPELVFPLSLSLSLSDPLSEFARSKVPCEEEREVEKEVEIANGVTNRLLVCVVCVVIGGCGSENTLSPVPFGLGSCSSLSPPPDHRLVPCVVVCKCINSTLSCQCPLPRNSA